MRIRKSNYELSLTETDVQQIRLALRKWGESDGVVENFNGADVHQYIEGWQDFVETDWENWNIYEYYNDLSCRYWLQVFIENTKQETRRMIENSIQQFDGLFKEKMKPATDIRYKKRQAEPFSEEFYFWETHTIHPE